MLHYDLQTNDHTEAYSEPCSEFRTFEVERFSKLANGFYHLFASTKHFILDIER